MRFMKGEYMEKKLENYQLARYISAQNALVNAIDYVDRVVEVVDGGATILSYISTPERVEEFIRAMLDLDAALATFEPEGNRAGTTYKRICKDAGIGMASRVFAENVKAGIQLKMENNEKAREILGMVDLNERLFSTRRNIVKLQKEFTARFGELAVNSLSSDD